MTCRISTTTANSTTATAARSTSSATADVHAGNCRQNQRGDETFRQKNELTCVILCAKVIASNIHTARGAQANVILMILNVPACFVKHKGAIFYDHKRSGKNFANLAETQEPLRSAIEFTPAKWSKLQEYADEEWRDVIGFDGHYQIRNLGPVKSFKWGVEKILKTNCGKENYPRISLYQNGKLKKILVHVLVAKVFLPNPNNFPVVNHKDNIRTNNRVENLEWVTYSENQRQTVQIGARKFLHEAEHPLAKLTREQVDYIRAVHIPADSKWIEAQAHANVRGEKNPIFSGAKVGHTLFLGSQACIMAQGEGASWEEDRFDYKNQYGVSISRFFGLKKAQFKYDGENYTDFAYINVLTSSEDD